MEILKQLEEALLWFKARLPHMRISTYTNRMDDLVRIIIDIPLTDIVFGEAMRGMPLLRLTARCAYCGAEVESLDGGDCPKCGAPLADAEVQVTTMEEAR